MHCFEEIYCPHENLFNSERYVDFNENLFVLRDRERERSCTQLRTRGFSLYKSPCSPAVIRMGKPRKSTTGQQRKSVGPACPGLLPVLNDHPPSWRKVPQLPQRNEGNVLVCSLWIGWLLPQTALLTLQTLCFFTKCRSQEVGAHVNPPPGAMILQVT